MVAWNNNVFYCEESKMKNPLHNLPESQQGFVCIAIGIIALFSARFMEKSIFLVIILLALYIIFVGCKKLHLFARISQLHLSSKASKFIYRYKHHDSHKK